MIRHDVLSADTDVKRAVAAGKKALQDRQMNQAKATAAAKPPAIGSLGAGRGGVDKEGGA